jgi:hypothetical protein
MNVFVERKNYGHVETNLTCISCASGPYRHHRKVECKNCRIGNDYKPTSWVKKEA